MTVSESRRLYNQAGLYRAQTLNEDAEAINIQSIALAHKEFGAKHPQVAQMMKTLSTASMLLKRNICNLLLIGSYLALICSQCCYAAPGVDVFGDANLHRIEQEIVALAQESRKDISYQEHQKLLDTVSEKIVGGISDVSSLATLAIWAALNSYSNALENGNINYNDVMSAAYSSAITKIGSSKGPDAEAALWRVAHQVNIDGHISEELCAAMSSITKKDFLFGDRVYVRFKDKVFQNLPMAPENAAFKVALCEELWQNWKSPVAGSVNLCARATFVIDADRQITNIKVVPFYFGKEKNQTASLQFQDAARSTLEHCTIKETLPGGLRKVQLEVDFYGR